MAIYLMGPLKAAKIEENPDGEKKKDVEYSM